MSTEENWETVALLVAMLKQISQGADANKTFGVAVGRGVRKSLGEQERLFARRAALAWIASAIRPPAEGGLGIPLEKAFEDAAEEFEFEVDSLKTYWGNNPEWRRSEFDRPLFSLFRRQKND